MKRCAVLFLLLAAGLFADSFQELSAQANAARESNNVAAAVPLYRQALALNPSWQQGWWFLGTIFYDGDKFAAGQEAFQHFVELAPQVAPGWAFLGLCEFETADYAKALQDVQHALTLGAGNEPQLGPVLLYHEALLLTRTGDFDSALQKYSALLRGMQGANVNASLLLSIGLAALRSPLIPKEVPAVDQPLYTDAGRAAVLVLLGQFDQADAAWRALVEKYPRARNVHYAHGVYLIARDPDQAFEEFHREMELHPDNTAAAAMLAWGMLTRGDPEEALPYARKAATAPNANGFSKYLLGRALVETGEIRPGLALLKSADQTNADVHVTLAVAYARLGQPVEARAEREIAMRMESENQSVAHP